MLNNISISEFKFPNLGLGYYAIVMAFLLVLLYKGRDTGKKKSDLATKDKYERILFTTLLLVFLFLLICIAITDMDLLKDAMFYKIGLPRFLIGFFNFIAIYRNLIVVIILICFLFAILLYLYIDFYQKKNYRYGKFMFIGLIVFSIILELFDFGSHYAGKSIRSRLNSLFTRELNELVKNDGNYKYLIAVDKEYLPPYTSGSQKALMDFATYHKLQSNVGLYARNQKKNNRLYKDTSDPNFKYEVSDDTIYVFEKPCFDNCRDYDLTYYSIKNYIIGVTRPFDEIDVYDIDKVNKSKIESENMIHIKLIPIEDMNKYIENNSRHDYGYTAIPNKSSGKVHTMVLRKCKVCGYSDEVFDAMPELGHTFTDYIDDENAAVARHGTMTAHCICGKTDTKVSDRNVLGHSYVQKIVQYPSNDAPGIRQLVCSECDKKLIGTEKYINVELEYVDVPFDDKEHEPSIIVKDSNGEIIDKSLYVIKYVSNRVIGEAKVMVSFVDNNDGEYYPFDVYFYILPLEPRVISAKRNNDDSVGVSWEKPDSRLDGYEIEYSNDRNFSEDTIDSIIINRRNAIDFDIPAVDANKHFLRMRSYKSISGEKDEIYSAWSNVVEIK